MSREQSTYDEHLSQLSLNERVGMWVTDRVGTMWCAYIFCVIAIVALPAALSSKDPVIIVAWISQAFLQLVLLPMIMVGQNVQSRHTELQAQADYETNVEAEHRIEDLQTKLSQIEVEKLDKILAFIGGTGSVQKSKKRVTGNV